jgi:ABC-2 type transport system permease protein
MPMPDTRHRTFFALLRRELQEYRLSLLWTPLLLVAGLTLVMLGTVLLADEFSALGESLSQLAPSRAGDSQVSIHIDGTKDGKPVIEYRVEQQLPDDGQYGPGSGSAAAPPAPAESLPPGSFNPLLMGMHSLFLFVLLLVCANYLLAVLFTDRRDRSILFFKSMPVSELQNVLASFAVAILVAPMLFIAASAVAQVLGVLLGMVFLWRMDMDPYALLTDYLDLAPLLARQMGGWLLMTLWLAPTYAWLLLASAGARRSPFMVAVAPLLGVVVLEKIVLGSTYLATAFSRHLPHYDEGSYAGFYWYGLQDVLPVLLGLLFAAAALWGAIYLRRYLFEI